MRAPPPRRARQLLLLLGLVALVAGCPRREKLQDVMSPQVEALRFSHLLHKEQRCTQCHDQAAVLSGRIERPGKGHSSCDSGECHRAEFDKETPGELCMLCHERVGGEKGEPSPLLSYPPREAPRQLPSRFSHAVHLDAAAMEGRLGFHLSCTDCHQLDGDRPMKLPGHLSCSRCHAPESAPVGSPRLDQCSGCHRAEDQAVERSRSLIRGDLSFSHGRHRQDRRGKLVTCSRCHVQTAQTTGAELGKHASPAMAVCVDCHNDGERTPDDQRMSQCETCHATRSAGLSALAPRSHMPASERPTDHTRAFRRDHAMDARADSKRCAKCHTVLSGNVRNTCDECHQVMRPSDHVVTWREYDHGADAATEAERCTTCHQVDYCVACHQQRPRSHFPQGDWRTLGHGTQAILSLRSCLACHQPQRDCLGSGCHVGGLQ